MRGGSKSDMKETTIVFLISEIEQISAGTLFLKILVETTSICSKRIAIIKLNLQSLHVCSTYKVIFALPYIYPLKKKCIYSRHVINRRSYKLQARASPTASRSTAQKSLFLPEFFVVGYPKKAPEIVPRLCGNIFSILFKYLSPFPAKKQLQRMRVYLFPKNRTSARRTESSTFELDNAYFSIV